MPSSIPTFAILLVFGAPWTWLLRRRSSDASLEGFVQQVALGYAISFVTLFAASQLRLALFAAIWSGGALACVVDAIRQRDLRAQRPHLGVEGTILLLSCALYFTLRCLPFLLQHAPTGWDAYFHMTIAEQIVARGRAVHDWLPYEDMPINYPIGSHLLLALTQWLSGVRPHEFFASFVVWFTLLTGLQIFALTTRATRDRATGCYAALAYLFLADLGSLDYTRWSGLPNLIGMYLFLALLTSLLEDDTPKRSIATFVVFFLAACFVHHHVMVTAGLCLIWTSARLFFRGDRDGARRIFLGLAASGLIGLPYFLVYLVRSANLGETSIGAYVEPAPDAFGLVQKIGLGFSIAVAAGVYRYFARGEPLPSRLTQPLVAMLGLYVALEWVVRTATQLAWHREVAPFTPSRFITDAVALLAIFAGLFFRSMQGSRQENRIPIALLIVVGFIAFNRAAYRDSFGSSLTRPRRIAYEWIRTHSEPDTVLLDSRFQTTYFTRRMSSSFPLPTSEYEALAVNRVRLQRVFSGAPPESLGHRVLAIVEPAERAPSGRLLWRDRSGLRIIERAGAPKPQTVGL